MVAAHLLLLVVFIGSIKISPFILQIPLRASLAWT
jgi:hypothetical protein